jgi:hypothetical protein
MPKSAVVVDVTTLMARAELIDLVARLREQLRTQETTLAEIIEERDAALMLNELCHY